MTLMSEVCNKLTMDKEPGFTLVELLITIVVLTILLAAGVPAFQSFIKNNRVTGQANDLISAIQLARSEALKRGENIVVCASSDQATCTGKDTWTDGWIVFSDLDRDTDLAGHNAPDIGTGKCLKTEDCIMRTNKGLSQGSTLTSDAGLLCFLPTGLSGTHLSGACSRDSADTVDFTIEAKNCEKTQARKISVTPQGHTSVATVGCS
jgi:type IV fimbrial biogenesis protein FimT